MATWMDTDDDSGTISYPKFKFDWCKTLWNHYVIHGDAIEALCDWCQQDNHIDLETPIINQNSVPQVDKELHKLAVSIFMSAVIRKMIRPLFEKFHKESKATTSATLHKGRLTEEQCIEIIQKYPEVNIDIEPRRVKHLTPTERGRLEHLKYVDLCESRIKLLFETNNILYDLLIEEEERGLSSEEIEERNTLSFVNKVLELPDEVAQYAPLIEQTTQFQVIISRCQTLFPIRTPTEIGKKLVLPDLPKPSALNLSDLAFLLLLMHLDGLVALTPTCFLDGYPNVIRSDTILYLVGIESEELSKRSALQTQVKELEAFLDLVAEF